MNQLLNDPNVEQTMTSKEFLELLPKKRHDNIKRTMETLRDRDIIAFTQSEEMQTKGNNREYSETIYHVNKRDSYIVMGQLSPEFMAELVDRWQALEGLNLDLQQQINKLTEIVLTRLPDQGFISDAPVVTPKVGGRGHRMERWHVEQSEDLARKGLDKHQISQRVGYGLKSVDRTLKGEKDHLLS